MTVAELIAKLQLMPSEAIVSIYESDPDDYIPIAGIECMDENKEVRIYSGLET